jgi:hypothetical protein
VWWFTPIISELRRLKQEAYKFNASLGYMVSPCLNKIKKSHRLRKIKLHFPDPDM